MSDTRHWCPKAVPAPVPGFYVRRIMSVIAEGLANLTNLDGEGVIIDDGVRPKRGKQVIPRLQLSLVLSKVLEQIEGFGRQRDDFGAPPQLPRRGVQLKRAEQEYPLHVPLYPGILIHVSPCHHNLPPETR
jgi:hypothetical protein